MSPQAEERRGGSGPAGNQRATTVVVGDDHQLYCRGLEVLLGSEGDMRLVADASSATAVVAAVLAHRPDVVLLEMTIGGQSGIDACTAIKTSSPQTKVLFLTSSDRSEDLVKALMVGACGYLHKSLPSEQIVDAVRLAHGGEVVVPPPMARHLVTEYSRLATRTNDTGGQRGRARTLSEREIEVLTWITRGKPNREIAVTMAVSENTVKNHVRNIMVKLQVSSRTEAALHAVRENIVVST